MQSRGLFLWTMPLRPRASWWQIKKRPTDDGRALGLLFFMAGLVVVTHEHQQKAEHVQEV